MAVVVETVFEFVKISKQFSMIKELGSMLTGLIDYSSEIGFCRVVSDLLTI